MAVVDSLSCWQAGEMNGKSGNLNNCLTQIYPEDVPMPPSELVAIFDADQVHSRCCHDLFCVRDWAARSA